MYESEIRWPVLIPVSILMGMGMLFSEVAGLWYRPDFRPDVFWCLAFCAALRAPPVASMLAYGWCGLMRDLLLGPKPGAAALAFVAVGWMTLYWKQILQTRNWLGHALSAGAAAFLVALVKHALDAGGMADDLALDIFVVSAGDAVLTLAAYLPIALVLTIPWFCPWRERSGLF